MSHVHVYAPPVTRKAISSGHCPDCKRRSRFISFHYEWHGWSSTCLRCGRKWEDGEWIPLDFVRGVRAANVKMAKARYRSVSPDLHLPKEGE